MLFGSQLPRRFPGRTGRLQSDGAGKTRPGQTKLDRAVTSHGDRNFLLLVRRHLAGGMRTVAHQFWLDQFAFICNPSPQNLQVCTRKAGNQHLFLHNNRTWYVSGNQRRKRTFYL